MVTGKTIRVMIVDEHDMVRKGLATAMLINADLELVGEARNGEEAVRKCEHLQPDVLLMDLMMPVMNGTEATRIISRRWPRVRVIILSASQEPDLVREVLEAGAVGYLLKNVTLDELAGAIRAAHAGQSILGPEIAKLLSDSEH